MLPGDHKMNLDDDDVRETKKAKSVASQRGKDAAAGAGGGAGARSSGNAWGGFGSGGGGGGDGGGGRHTGTAMMGGIRRRMSVTKQQALRSKGVFKIAPQSKVRCFFWRRMFVFVLMFREEVVQGICVLIVGRLLGGNFVRRLWIACVDLFCFFVSQDIMRCWDGK